MVEWGNGLLGDGGGPGLGWAMDVEVGEDLLGLLLGETLGGGFGLGLCGRSWGGLGFGGVLLGLFASFFLLVLPGLLEVFLVLFPGSLGLGV